MWNQGNEVQDQGKVKRNEYESNKKRVASPLFPTRPDNSRTQGVIHPTNEQCCCKIFGHESRNFTLSKSRMVYPQGHWRIGHGHLPGMVCRNSWCFPCVSDKQTTLNFRPRDLSLEHTTSGAPVKNVDTRGSSQILKTRTGVRTGGRGLETKPNRERRVSRHVGPHIPRTCAALLLSCAGKCLKSLRIT